MRISRSKFLLPSAVPHYEDNPSSERRFSSVPQRPTTTDSFFNTVNYLQRTLGNGAKQKQRDDATKAWLDVYSSPHALSHLLGLRLIFEKHLA